MFETAGALYAISDHGHVPLRVRLALEGEALRLDETVTGYLKNTLSHDQLCRPCLRTAQFYLTWNRSAQTSTRGHRVRQHPMAILFAFRFTRGVIRNISTYIHSDDIARNGEPPKFRIRRIDALKTALRQHALLGTPKASDLSLKSEGLLSPGKA